MLPFIRCIIFKPMDEEDSFYIRYKGESIKVSAIRKEAIIYFIVYLKIPVVVAEGMVNESWVWFEEGQGETLLAAQLGDLIEKADI